VSHLSFEALADWWTGDLPEAAQDDVELHLMGCERCAAEAERVGAVVTALRATIPTFVTAAHLEALRARGLRIGENRFEPGVRQEVAFPPDLDLLVHRLGGMDLRAAAQVAVTVESERSGAAISEAPDVPFDRERGEILVACQQHFRDLPHDIVFRVRARDAWGEEREAVYHVPHVFG
jgi:anti-sigma factor RsiW